jgi:heme/copper-type cytochrome/quinol oxidase subunit 2
VKARLLGSLVLGAIAAAIVVIYDDTANHAGLVRAAARSHQTAVSILASGFAGLTLIVAAVVFVISLLAARYRARAGGPAWKARYSNPESRRYTGIRR